MKKVKLDQKAAARSSAKSKEADAQVNSQQQQTTNELTKPEQQVNKIKIPKFSTPMPTGGETPKTRPTPNNPKNSIQSNESEETNNKVKPFPSGKRI